MLIIGEWKSGGHMELTDKHSRVERVERSLPVENLNIWNTLFGVGQMGRWHKKWQEDIENKEMDLLHAGSQ